MALVFVALVLVVIVEGVVLVSVASVLMLVFAGGVGVGLGDDVGLSGCPDGCVGVGGVGPIFYYFEVSCTRAMQSLNVPSTL